MKMHCKPEKKWKHSGFFYLFIQKKKRNMFYEEKEESFKTKEIKAPSDWLLKYCYNKDHYSMGDMDDTFSTKSMDM